MKHQIFQSFVAILFLLSCGQSQVINKNRSQVAYEEESNLIVPVHDGKLTVAEVKGLLSDPLPKVEKKPVPRVRPKPVLSKKLKKYCKKIQKSFRRWGWGYSKCQNLPWYHVRDSVLGIPLIWMAYGDEDSNKINHKNTTMILCGVHGDEITPVKFCFDIIRYLEQHPELYQEGMVVVAPIVNPDSFFKKYPSRTNQRRIDINRNFPTKDWKKKAISLWRKKYRRDKRRYPGKRPLSEPEVLFQINLIKRYKPNKLVSVHAPLTLIDYDGPTKKLKSSNLFQNQLLITMSEKADGYKVKDYPFFPGSLGNWAGNERNIPTYTLELPSSDNRKHKKFWKMFKPAIRAAIVHDFKKKPEVAKNPETIRDENSKELKNN